MRFSFFLLLFSLIDQLAKQAMLRWLAEPMWWIQDQLGLVLSYNEGIAFSLPLTGTWSILVMIAVMLILIFWYLRLEKSWLVDLVFGLILGGAAGNLLDRLLYGAVIDFVHFFSWPVFNFADAFITIGFGLLIVTSSRFTAS